MTVSQGKSTQRGAILAVTLACLVVVGLLMAVTVQRFVVHHRRAAQREQQMRAFWVCESALSRAVGQLAVKPDYQGETWEIPADRLDGGMSAVAQIQVHPSAAGNQKRKVAVEMHCRLDNENRIVSRRQIEVTLPLSGDSP